MDEWMDGWMEAGKKKERGEGRIGERWQAETKK